MSGNVDGFNLVTFLERAVPVTSNDDVGEMHDPLVKTLEVEGVDPTVGDADNTAVSKGAAESATHPILNTHIDTVSSHVPYDRDEDVIHGRGSCDAKDLLAALLSAFFIADPGPDTRVTPAIMPNEGLLSTDAAQLGLDGNRYIVDGPTGLDVYTTAEGRFEGAVSLSGVAVHTAEPQSGVNAVDALVLIPDALRSFGDDREAYPGLGPAMLTPAMVDDGANLDWVPTDC